MIWPALDTWTALGAIGASLAVVPLLDVLAIALSTFGIVAVAVGNGRRVRWAENVLAIWELRIGLPICAVDTSPHAFARAARAADVPRSVRWSIYVAATMHHELGWLYPAPIRRLRANGLAWLVERVFNCGALLMTPSERITRSWLVLRVHVAVLQDRYGNSRLLAALMLGALAVVAVAKYTLLAQVVLWSLGTILALDVLGALYCYSMLVVLSAGLSTGKPWAEALYVRIEAMRVAPTIGEQWTLARGSWVTLLGFLSDMATLLYPPPLKAWRGRIADDTSRRMALSVDGLVVWSAATGAIIRVWLLKTRDWAREVVTLLKNRPKYAVVRAEIKAGVAELQSERDEMQSVMLDQWFGHGLPVPPSGSQLN